MKTRILFVDDEANVLNGLRRMLRSKRNDWDMSFTDSGEKAVELMKNNKFDAVISDMRMPKMDGAALLRHVRRNQPAALRVILSGYSEQESVMRTVGPAHQYLAKPCDAGLLVDTINRAMALRRFLNKRELVELISGIERLPSPPDIFSRLLRQLDTPLIDGTDIADTIAEDLAMTAQTLKLINSAYFALPQKIDSPHHAVRLLGTDTLKSLVLIAGFYKQFSGDAGTAAVIERLSRRCLGIGTAAHAIAKEEGCSTEQVDQATSAGVLTHIGTLALMDNWPERFEQAVGLVEREALDIVDAERRVFGAAHPEIGAYMLGLWGFADPITEAVAYHHSPRHSPPGQVPSVIACVYAAQHLTRTVEAAGDETDVLAGTEMDMDYLRGMGLEDRLPVWIELVRELKLRAHSEQGK